MSTIDVRIEQSDVREVKRALSGIRKGTDKALKNAVNRTLTKTKKFMADETTTVLNVKKSRVRKSLQTRRASPTTLSGSVRSTGKPLNLIEFGAREKKSGVSVKIWRNQGRETIKHAFIFTADHGKRLVAWRKDTKGHVGSAKKKDWMAYGALPKKYRLPIEALTGPRIQDIMDRRDVITKIEDKAGIQIKKELDHQVEQLLRKYG